MKNFLLGVLLCYLFVSAAPKAKAGVSNDIQLIVESLRRITKSIEHIEKIAVDKQCKPGK